MVIHFRLVLHPKFKFVSNRASILMIKNTVKRICKIKFRQLKIFIHIFKIGTKCKRILFRISWRRNTRKNCLYFMVNTCVGWFHFGWQGSIGSNHCSFGVWYILFIIYEDNSCGPKKENQYIANLFNNFINNFVKSTRHNYSILLDRLEWTVT